MYMASSATETTKQFLELISKIFLVFILSENEIREMEALKTKFINFTETFLGI